MIMLKTIYLTAVVVLLSLNNAAHAGWWEDMQRALGFDTADRTPKTMPISQGEMFDKHYQRWTEEFPARFEMYLQAMERHLPKAKVDPDLVFTREGMRIALAKCQEWSRGRDLWLDGRSADIDTPFILLRESAEYLQPGALGDIHRLLHTLAMAKEAKNETELAKQYEELSQNVRHISAYKSWESAEFAHYKEIKLRREAEELKEAAARKLEVAEKRPSDASTSIAGSGSEDERGKLLAPSGSNKKTD